MLDSLYIGLTGLIGYSKDLTVIGNNAANLNTPGYKSQQLLFSDLFYQSQQLVTEGGDARFDIGAGLGTGTTRRNFAAGDLRQTGGDQDVAIDGDGFFVLRRGNETLLTRAGQFSFNADGVLISEQQNARVAAYANGTLRDIDISGLRTLGGRPTSRISFTGTLSTNDQPTSPHSVNQIPVFDSAGGAHAFSVKFTNNTTVTPGSWLIEVRDERNNVLKSGEIRFDTSGAPAAGFNTIDLSFAPTGVSSTNIQLFFGDPGTTTGARSLSAATSDLSNSSQDGLSVGSLTKASFDANGTLQLTYSNGETRANDTLALATLDNLQSLEPRQGATFVAPDRSELQFGNPSSGRFGRIQAGSIEISNVDLAQEFSDLIVSQRGYQASSQVISTANEMIQQLFDTKQRR